jgi:hypothetical protein
LAGILFADIDSDELRSFVRTLDRVRERLRRAAPPAEGGDAGARRPGSRR